MTMRAITKIPKGKEITHAYTEPLDPLMTRRSILELGKFFQVIGCNCQGGQLYNFKYTLLYTDTYTYISFDS